MTLKINNNPSAINAHRNLYVNERSLNKSMEQISSGLRIVRAADGPASLIISEQMRSQIKGIEQAIRNSEVGVAMMQTTEAAINEVNRMLTSLRMVAVHAANEAVNDELMLEADQQEVDNILAAIDRIARDTSFGKRKVLDGSAGANGIVTGEGMEFVKASHLTQESPEEGYNVVLTQAATRTGKVSSVALTQAMVSAGEKITVVENGKEATVKGTDKDTPQTLIARLQGQIERSGMQVDTTVDEKGTIYVIHRKYGSKHDLKVYSDTDGVLSEVGGDMESAIRGNDIQGTINGELAMGDGRVLSALPGSRNTDGIVVRYTGNAGKPGGPAIDPEDGYLAGKVHVAQNSLRFQLGDNYDQNGSVSVESFFTTELGEGVVNPSGFKSLRDINVKTFEGANDSLKIIQEALDKVSSIRGDIGAFQKNLLESNLNNMMVMRESMIFSESTIRDADIAQEMTAFTRNQLKKQSAIAMTGHANENAKAILKILQ